MDGLGPIDIQILIDNPSLLRTLLQGERDFQSTNRKVTQQAQQSGAELDKWAQKAAQAATAYFSISAAKNFLSEVVKVRGEFEQLNVAYETILKSKTKGDALFAETVKFAATTPFNLTEVATATKQLLAYGFAAKDINSVLTTTGNIAAGVSAPLSDIIYLYGTLKTQGRAYSQDIRQFTGRGIPIIQELAKQFGVTDDQVNKLVESGKVGFPQIEKAFNNLTGSSGIFFNLMQKQSLTLTGQLSNLEDAFQQLLNKIGSSSDGFLKGGISVAADLINNYQRLLDTIELLIVVYGSYRAALLVQVALSKASAIANAAQSLSHLLLQGAMEAQTAATVLLNSEMLAGAITTAAYTAGIAALALVAYSLYNATTTAEASQKNLTDINIKGEKAALALKQQTESLTRTVTDHTKSEELRISALSKLREITGDRLKQYSDEEVKAGKAKAAIDAYTASIVASAKTAAAASKIQDLQGQLIDVDTKGLSGIPLTERIGTGLLDVLSGKATFSNEKALQNYKDRINQQIKDIRKVYQTEIDKANVDTNNKGNTSSKFTIDLSLAVSAKGNGKLIADYNKLVSEASGKNDLESLQKALQEKLDALAPGDKQQSALKAKLIALQKLIDTYSTKADAKGLRDLESEAQRRAAILQKIYDLNQKYNTGSISDDQQKLQAIRDGYNKLRADIDKYNANPANKVKINKRTLQKNENSAEDNQALLNENDFIAKDIDTKKNLYAEYNDYKTKLGKDAADKEYADLLKSGEDLKTYLDNLAASIPAGPLSGALQARKELILKASVDEKKQQAAQYLEALSSTLNFEEQANLIREKYLKRAADLRKAGKDKQAQLALDQGEAELEQLKLNAESQVDTYRSLAQTIESLTIEQANFRLKQAQVTADAELAAGRITKEQYEKIIAYIRQAQDTIKNNTAAQGALAIAGALGEIGQALVGLDDNLANTINGFARAFDTVGNLTANVSKLKTAFASFAATKANNGGGFLGTVSAITSVIPIAGAVVGGVIKAVGAVVGLFKAAKESAIASAKELERYQDSLITGEINYNALLRDRVRSQTDLTNLALQELAARQKLLDTQKLQATADYNTLLAKIQATGQQVTGEHTEKYGGFLGIARKKKVVQDLAGLGGVDYDTLEKLYTEGKLTDATKTWFEQLKKVKDEMGSIDDATKAVKDELDQVFTGTTSNSLAKAILDGLKAGKRGFKDFSDDFGDSIREAFISQFESGFLNDAVKEYYKKFAELSESGGGLDSAEQAQLKELYKGLVDGASTKYADVLKVIGDAGVITPANSSALSGGITGISADQANVVAGAMRGVQLAVVQANAINSGSAKTLQDQLAESKAQTLIQMSIASSTKRTADNSDQMRDSLKNIDSNTSSKNLENAIRAAGK
ncbi:tape measure protein [Mucilaginibacter glaciei]|uniref:Tape measure protein n=1 Tax=Mucilaginibacter glaciei TaxID=2772109 RepID=A0A926NYJ7_9SPHI|nr:tape measure protein [Mucilaginibacter glaciei]MBD1394258.1 tape measure protein [Mucilaginibacter glaciei]